MSCFFSFFSKSAIVWELLQLTLLREAETGMLSTCTTLIKRRTQQKLMFYRAINYFKGWFDMLLLGVTDSNLHVNISWELIKWSRRYRTSWRFRLFYLSREFPRSFQRGNPRINYECMFKCLRWLTSLQKKGPNQNLSYFDGAIKI